MIPDKKEIKKRQEHFLSRRPSRYEEKVHVPLLIEIFSVGGGRAQFCTKALIVESTFYEWLKQFSEFKTAYEYGVKAAECVWEEMGKEKEINASWWLTIMKNRFGYTNDRKLSVPKIRGSQEFHEHFQHILEHVANGDITGSEAHQLASLITAGQAISNNDKVKMLTEQIQKLSAIAGVPCEL